MSDFADQGYRFAPHERPLFPGSPYTPAHPAPRRAAYFCIALLVGLTGSLGNALVSVNTANLAGAMGLYVAQAAVLPAIYVATNASANLMLVKLRIQFGIPAITNALLAAYIVATLIQIALPGFGAAILVRAVHGMAASGLLTMAIYNLLQFFPPARRPLAIVIAISLPQFATPIARLIPIELLALDHWQGLHLIELGVALAALAALAALPVPPNERSKAFEPLDFVTAGLFIPAITLVCIVLATGRYLWWTDTPWLGFALAAAVPLLTAALLVERRRARPLIQVSWIGTAVIARFAIVAILLRIALAEQSYGAVGLLTSGGLTGDQLHTLFAIVAVAMVLGLVTAIVTLHPARIRLQVMAAALAIALGAWLDSDASNITRPEQLYFSQALIGFGTTLSIGPALAFGILRVFERGPNHFVTLVVLFSITQNIGGLAGSALLGSYQIARTRAHAVALSEHLVAADPQVATRIQAGVGALAGAVTDPGARATQGAALLGQAMTREATILAYNDVFRFVAVLALLTAAFLAYIEISYRVGWTARPRAEQQT